MAQILGKPVTPYVDAQLQRVPLFIHVPGVKGNVNHTYGGDVDVRPTVLHLLGVPTQDYISFGTDLLSKEHRQVVPFRNGDVMTPKYDSINGQCYANPEGEKVDNSLCQPYEDLAKKELQLSDKVVYGDLLRFYHPDNFEPVDKSTINYNIDQTKLPQRYSQSPLENPVNNSK
jgi:lipoteichoic acid synthase